MSCGRDGKLDVRNATGRLPVRSNAGFPAVHAHSDPRSHAETRSSRSTTRSPQRAETQGTIHRRIGSPRLRASARVSVWGLRDWIPTKPQASNPFLAPASLKAQSRQDRQTPSLQQTGRIMGPEKSPLRVRLVRLADAQMSGICPVRSSDHQIIRLSDHRLVRPSDHPIIGSSPPC